MFNDIPVKIQKDLTIKNYKFTSIKKITSGYKNDLYLLELKHHKAKTAVLKIFKSDWRSAIERCEKELYAYKTFYKKIPLPEITAYSSTLSYILFEKVPSEKLQPQNYKNVLEQITKILVQIHSHKKENFNTTKNNRADRLKSNLDTHISNIMDKQKKEFLNKLLIKWYDNNFFKEEFVSFTEFTHGDFKLENIIISKNAVAGVIDWEFSKFTSRYVELGAFYEQIPAKLKDYSIKLYEKESGTKIDLEILNLFRDYFYIKTATIFFAYPQLFKMSSSKRKTVEETLLDKLKHINQK